MNLAYADTSVLVAIAFAEPGHEELATRVEGFDRVISSNLLEAEFRSALVREGVPPQSAGLLNWLGWVFPERALSAEYQQVLAHGYVRGADLWHLACALYLRSKLGQLSFLTLDERQRELAGELGMAG